jgi:hypothetical protein
MGVHSRNHTSGDGPQIFFKGPWRRSDESLNFLSINEKDLKKKIIRHILVYKLNVH